MKMSEGKIWWITGATSGIGAALADASAQAGVKVILSGRNLSALTAIEERCSPGALVLPFEATDFENIPSLVDRAWEWAVIQGGPINGLFNHAGITQRFLANETVFEVYQRIIDVDLLAPIALTQALLPRMVQAGGGRIVAISSVAGIVGVPLRSAYCAAKHGLIGYHDSVRAENEHLGVQVHVVAPGSIRTNVSKNALTADGSRRGVSDSVIDNGMSPAEAAKAILPAIEPGKRELVLATRTHPEIAAMRRHDPDALFD